MRKKRLLVSIVNYKTSSLICEMLPQLMKEIMAETDDVVIVDNASPDNSIEVLTKFINDEINEHNLIFLPSEKNGGFSYGNNYAIEYATKEKNTTYEYILLLNPDTLISKGSISELLTFMDKTPKAGIAGSKLVALNGNIQISAFNFPSITSEFLSGMRLGILDRVFEEHLVAPKKELRTNTKVQWVAGASMIIRSKVLDDVGMMDENYFLYYEETDLCLSASKYGWETWYVPSSVVTHIEGQSTGVISKDTLRRRRPKYWFQSRQYFFIKNYGVTKTLLADISWILAYILFRLRAFLQQKRLNEPKFIFIDFCCNSIIFSGIRKISPSNQ